MSRRLRVVVTGCQGRLGRHLLRVLLPQAECLGLGRPEEPPREHPAFQYVRLGSLESAGIDAAIDAFGPDAIVNAAAFTDVDGAETRRDECRAVNVGLVETLARATRRHGAYLAQVSTDYVFDGTAGPYDVDAPTAPLGWYGATKLEAEQLLAASPVEHGVFRTLVLYGKGPGLKLDFVGWVRRELEVGRTIRVVTDQTGNCTWALDLAQALALAAERRARGVFHVANRGLLSRHELALLIARVFGLDPMLVHPVTTEELGQQAKRPLRSGLKLSRSEEALGMRFPALERALERYKRDDGQSLVAVQETAVSSGA